jgi:predicted O-linked N-acetylglucosamine transferase (SPINDLY family)
MATQPPGDKTIKAVRPRAPQARPAWLQEAVQRVHVQGVSHGLEWLRAAYDAQEVPTPSWPACVELLGKALSISSPESALRVLDSLMSAAQGEEASSGYVPPTSVQLLAGLLQDKLGQRGQAKQSMQAVVQSDRAQPLEVLQAANLLVRLGDQALALQAAERAFEAMGRPLEHAATLLYIAQVTAHWPLVDRLTAQLRQGHEDGQTERINESPRTHVLWCDDEVLNHAVLQHWSRQNLPAPVGAAPRPASPHGRRLRVGYLSSDFREHPTARLILGVLRHHDRRQVELFMYCSGWDDGSALRQAVVAQFEHVHSVAGLGDGAAAALMRSHQIDVLVELNGPTRAHRMGILSHRPAPVQVDYLGWPGTVGGRVVDYVVGDAHTVPEGAEQHYAEKVIRLHPTYQANDHAAYPRVPKPTRREVGLPEDPSLVILGMFNAINKVHQAVWETWMQILQGAPHTVLWLLDPGEVARKAIASAAQAAGVPLTRIIASPKLPHAVHMARLQCCDLMLDPWPYGGHTSTADALYAGVPVLALEGHNFAGRVSPGLLRSAGLADLVCANPQAYVRRALDLVQRPAGLRALQERLHHTLPGSPVFDSAARARQLEQAFRVAVERVAQGQAPQHIGFNPPQAQVPGAQRAVSADPAVDGRRYKVAVVTPYFRVPEDKFRRCCASVAAQTITCDHIVVADGEPQILPEGFELIHMVLPANVGNSGATPRGFGGQYAFAQGYDAVAFLDADNWYEPRHVELAVQALEADLLDVVYTRRNIVFEDGEVLGVDDPQDTQGGHVDTNCYVVSKRAAFLMGFMALYPREFGAGEDRYIKKIIVALGLRAALIPDKTVWYESHWAIHHRLANKDPVAPLRKPLRSLARNWDARLFEQRTGLSARALLQRSLQASGKVTP